MILINLIYPAQLNKHTSTFKSSRCLNQELNYHLFCFHVVFNNTYVADKEECYNLNERKYLKSLKKFITSC